MRQGRNTSYGANEFVWKRNDVESDAFSTDHLERSTEQGRRGRKRHHKDKDREDRWAALDRDSHRGRTRRRIEDDAYFEDGLTDKPGRRPEKRQRTHDH